MVTLIKEIDSLSTKTRSSLNNKDTLNPFTPTLVSGLKKYGGQRKFKQPSTKFMLK